MISQISEEIKELVENAKSLEKVGRYEEAAKVLSIYWKNTDNSPDVSRLSKEEQAEILLRCGSLAGYIGSCKQKKGYQELAKDLLYKANSLFLVFEDIEKVAECETYYAYTCLRTGKLDEARCWVNSALKQEIDNNGDVRLYTNIVDGMILFREEKYDELVSKYRSLESNFFASKSDVLKGCFNGNYAYSLMKTGDKDGAITRFNLAKQFFAEAKHYHYLAIVDNNLAIFLKDEKVYGEGHKAAISARKNFKKIGDKTREGYSLDTRAQIYMDEGKYEEALKYINEAILLLSEGDNHIYLTHSRKTKKQIELCLKKQEDGLKSVAEAINIVNLFNDKPDKRISTIEKIISSNFQKCWTVDELAGIVNLSKSRFKKLFKQETQLSPTQFVRHLRFEKAKELLETTHLTIKEIGFAVGINDQSHFVRDFKKKYGISPTEYRNKF
jgi:AraC-like DNA-binding protein